MRTTTTEPFAGRYRVHRLASGMVRVADRAERVYLVADGSEIVAATGSYDDDTPEGRELRAFFDAEGYRSAGVRS
jgi:hypothetical protein